MQLVKPHVEGFSVPPLNEDEITETKNLTNEGKKRKSNEETKKKNKRKSMN